jgi:polyisoprenoid-binding protein YceI
MATQLQTKQGIVRVPTGTWQVDPKHSSVEFHVKHMMIATVRGCFKEFEGTIEAAPDVNDSRAYGLAKAASIDTNEPTRDEHLRSPDFLDGERYPEIRFQSKRIELSPEEARSRIRAVFGTLREAVTLGEFDDVLAQLDPEYADLLA